ncbi:MAG TPA: DEAD/DEAH box helicase [Thiobacillaceae bacterium]|nr:DEAD/DEAH box helicase [Thiobacillaceae bacterium]
MAASEAFNALGLTPKMLESVTAAGYTQPTPVQAQAIPMALDGHDLLVSSQTGSGKTAAFMLPCLQRLMEAGPAKLPRVLVLTPTRELAQQVAKATMDFGGKRGPRVALLVGGAPYAVQLKMLRGPVDIVVGTPGRVMDHMGRGRLDLSKVQTLVLDEADRMLDMGFIEDMETIAARLPAQRQTLLFSATLDGVVGKLAERMTRDARRIEIAKTPEATPRIEQKLLFADDHSHKLRLLDHLLGDVALTQAVVFTGTKVGAEDLATRLGEQGHAVEALHGDMNQGARNRALKALRDGRVRILVATDVAARGLDVPGISHVVNFDLPMQAEDYVHRIGRTGRAGREGRAFTLAHHREFGKVKGIERYTGSAIPVAILPGLEPKARTAKPAAGNGRKPSGWKPGYGKAGYGKPSGRVHGHARPTR